jgi:hypothetical protein
MAKIDRMIHDSSGMFVVTEDGERIEAPVIANDAGYSILNHDAGEKWVALQVADYGDGDAEVFECREGDTFETNEVGYTVRRTDNAGSLKWVEVKNV